MDGPAKNLKHSLQFQLSAWLCALIVILAVAAGLFSFWRSLVEANELQDDELRQIAAIFEGRSVSALPSNGVGDSRLADEPDMRIAVQLLVTADGTPAERSEFDLPLASNTPDGLRTVTVDGEEWRLFVRSLRSGERIAVGQRTAARDEAARDGAIHTTLPFMFLVPLLGIIVSVVVRRSLDPIARLSDELDRRAEGDLAPLPSVAVPNEIRSFTRSIDHLLARLSASMEAQRRFVADAAHELRSPLTALSLQAEGLSKLPLEPLARDQLDQLQRGVSRMRLLLNQLMNFARFQQQPASPVAPLHVRTVMLQVIEDLWTYAASRDVDLGVVDQSDVAVGLHQPELYAVIRNLVDNAVRYSPRGGRVDISLRARDDRAVLEVINEGAGIAPAERQRIFDPFYRVLGTDTEGSGLGLAIVKSLIDRAHGSIEVDRAKSSETAPGVRVTVKIPVAPHELESPQPMNAAHGHRVERHGNTAAASSGTR